MELKSIYFNKVYFFLFSAKTRIYDQNARTYKTSGAENSLFQFCLTITELFSPFYLEEMKNYWSLKVSRVVSSVIMRFHKPKVEYKLALQEKPQGSILTYYYKTNNLTRINWLNTRLIIASNKIRHEIPFKTKKESNTQRFERNLLT